MLSVIERLRIGLIGAGQNMCQKHIPGFQAISGVELAAVCNRHPESTAQVAQKYGIPQTFNSWEELVASDSVDAIVIGTWPNLHCEITCAALAAGKHVLTEARMAASLAEAQQMLEASRKASHLTTMVVPSPFGLQYGPYLDEMVSCRFLGDLREMVVIGANEAFWDYTQPMHPRQDRRLSGINVLSLGILHETACRYAPATTKVFAQSKIFEPKRPIINSVEWDQVTVPDSLQVVSQLEGGGRGLYHISSIALFGPGHHVHLYGSEGTIKMSFEPGPPYRETVWMGRIGGEEITKLELAPEKLGQWNVEQEFVGAIQGQNEVKLNSFETALEGIRFTAAVDRSAELGQTVELSSL